MVAIDRFDRGPMYRISLTLETGEPGRTRRFCSTNWIEKNPPQVNITLGDEKGQEIMTQSIFEGTGEKISDTAHKASRAASAVADAVEDGVVAARRAAKQGCYAAAECFDDTKRRV